MLTLLDVRPAGRPHDDRDVPRAEAPRGFHDCRGTWHAWDDLPPAETSPAC